MFYPTWSVGKISNANISNAWGRTLALPCQAWIMLKKFLLNLSKDGFQIWRCKKLWSCRSWSWNEVGCLHIYALYIGSFISCFMTILMVNSAMIFQWSVWLVILFYIHLISLLDPSRIVNRYFTVHKLIINTANL